MERKANKPQSSTKGIKVHDSLKVDARNPVPLDFAGSAFTALGSYQYIPFFNPDDDLFRTMLEARLLAPTHSSCILDKKFYSLGEGLFLKDDDDKKLMPDEFKGKINGRGQTINDIFSNTFESLLQHGNKFIEVVRSTIGGKKYVHCYVHTDMDCRLEENKDGGDSTHVIRSKFFRKSGIIHFSRTDKPVRIPLWNDNVLTKGSVWQKDKENKNIERTMFHIKCTVSGLEEGYGLPTFFAGLSQVVLEYKTARFNLDNFDNNMFLAGLLLLQGNLSVPEEKKLTQNIRKMTSGDGKQMRVLPLSTEGGLEGSKFVPFNDTHEGHFIDLDKRNEEKIIGAHQWSRALMDMSSDSSLGKGGEYLRNLFVTKYKTIIKPSVDMVMDNFFKEFLKIMDEWLGTKYSELPFYIKPVIPIQFEGQLDINSLLTVDEGRAAIGRNDLGGEKGKLLISEVAAKKQPGQTDNNTPPKTGKK